MKEIVLASRSIDRSEIFKRAKIPFTVVPSKVDEEKYKNLISDPIKLVKELAKAKALYTKELMSHNNKKAIIIAADTVVEQNGDIIGKAKNENEAFQILKNLINNKHNLITGVAITETNNPKIVIDHDSTVVHFSNLNDTEIWNYIKTGEWKGRAGAYSIRDKASLFIRSIEGSSSNVIGLPMHKIFEIIKSEFNFNLFDI